jgi:hypothetical protein
VQASTAWILATSPAVTAALVAAVLLGLVIVVALLRWLMNRLAGRAVEVTVALVFVPVALASKAIGPALGRLVAFQVELKSAFRALKPGGGQR